MPTYPFIHSADCTNPADNLELVCAHDHPAQPVEWLWPEKFPIGKVSMLIGDPGLGKTLVALDLAARLSRGNPCPKAGSPSRGGHQAPERSKHSPFDIRRSSFPPSPNPQSESSSPAEADNSQSAVSATPPSPFRLPPSSTILLSATDDLADTLRPRLDAAGADPRRIFVIPSIADLRHDFAQLRAAVERAPNCRLIIIDPINAYVGPSDSHLHSVMRKVLEPLAKLAKEKRIAVLAVAHLRKNEGAAIYRAAGSMGFVAAARAVWTIVRDQSNPTRTLMLPVKNNLAPAASGLAFTIESHTQTGAPVVAWSPDPVISSGDEALTRAEIADLNSARQWLAKALANGPRAARDIADEGAQYGFHERTLRRALHAIGGDTQFRDIIDGWWWSLPRAEAGGRKAEGHPETIQPSSDLPPSALPLPPSKFPLPPSPNPVPWCPLPKIFHDSPSSDTTSDAAHSPPPPPPKPTTIADSIAALKLLDRHRRNDARASSTSKRPRPKSTGDPVLAAMLAVFREEFARRGKNPPRKPDTS